MIANVIAGLTKGIAGSGGKVITDLQKGKTERIGNIRGWASPIVFLLTALPFIVLLWAWIGSIFLETDHHIPENAVNIVNAIGATFFFSIISILLTGSAGAGALLAKRKIDIDKAKHDKEMEVVKEIAKNPVNKSTFQIGLEETLHIEGGYADDPEDTGGETYRGIARNHHPKWIGWKIIDRCKRKRRKFPENLNEAKGLDQAVEDFYKAEFWDKYKCDQVEKIAPKVALELFDSSVNCGPSNGAKFLQRAINNCSYGLISNPLVDDGKIGKQTIDALEILCPKYSKAVYKSQNGELYQHYERIINNKPEQKKFFRGWVQNRT